MRILVPQAILKTTFQHLRDCGSGECECQVLWTSPWSAPQTITGVVHPKHRSHAGGFVLDSQGLNAMWLELATRGHGIRVQVHTHPSEAFHSPTDDRFPIVHTPGFLSLVIPNFAQGPIGFQDAFLAEIGADGRFRPALLDSRLTAIQ